MARSRVAALAASARAWCPGVREGQDVREAAREPEAPPDGVQVVGRVDLELAVGISRVGPVTADEEHVSHDVRAVVGVDAVLATVVGRGTLLGADRDGRDVLGRGKTQHRVEDAREDDEDDHATHHEGERVVAERRATGDRRVEHVTHFLLNFGMEASRRASVCFPVHTR